MNPEAKPITVRQRINKILDQQRLRPADFAVFSAHRINPPGVVSEQRRNFIRKKPRRIDHAFHLNRFGLRILFIPDPQSHADGVPRRLQRHNLCARNNVRPLICCHSCVGMYEFFRRDDPCGRHIQRGGAFDKRFANANLDRTDNPQALNAVILAALLQRNKLFFLMRIGRHHEFPRVPERHVVLLAEIVGEAIPLNAVPRLQRIFRIVDSRMIHPAVPRARRHAQLRKLLHKKNVLPALGNRARNRAADDSTAYDQNVCLVHEIKRIK